MQLSDEAKKVQRDTEREMRSAKRDLQKLQDIASRFERFSNKVERDILSTDTASDLDIEESSFRGVISDMEEAARDAAKALDKVEREANQDATIAREWASPLAEARASVQKFQANVAKISREVDAIAAEQRDIIRTVNDDDASEYGRKRYKVAKRVGTITGLIGAAGWLAAHLVRRF